jgi:hypothetical protein
MANPSGFRADANAAAPMIIITDFSRGLPCNHADAFSEGASSVRPLASPAHHAAVQVQCVACNLFGGRCDALARYRPHAQATCPYIPASCLGDCLECHSRDCKPQCSRKDQTRHERLVFSLCVLAVHNVSEISSDADRELAQTLRLKTSWLKKGAVTVQGVSFPATSARVMFPFTGRVRIAHDERGAPSWSSAQQDEASSLSLPDLIAAFSAARVAGNTSATPSRLLLAAVGQPAAAAPAAPASRQAQAASADPESASGVDASTVERLVSRIESLEAENVQLRSKAHTPSREHNVPLFGTGTAFGTLSRATAIELGKDCFSILYALGGDASLAPELLIREYPLSPCNGMSKLAHPYKIQFKVPTRANQTTAYTVEQMADLLGSGLQQFRHLIQASKSECLLPQDATLLPSEHSLAALVLTFANCAQKAEQNAASHCNVNPRSWLDIAKVADTYVHALISHVLKTHTSLPDYILHGVFARLSAVVVAPPPVIATQTMSGGEPKAKKARALKGRDVSHETCNLFNDGKAPCNAPGPCRYGRKHECAVCRSNHARSANAACQGALVAASIK